MTNDLPGETQAIAVALQIARQYGYGNVISRLQDEWSEKLQASGLSKESAAGGAWKPSWFWKEIDALRSRLELAEAVCEASQSYFEGRKKYELESYSKHNLCIDTLIAWSSVRDAKPEEGK